jgi:hypothetical protein
MMRRRTLLKQLFVLSAGLTLVPACREDRAKAGFLYKNITIDPDQEAMLASLAETIIPKTSTPGARDISAHLFVLKMMDDCSSKEEHASFMEGMKSFAAAAKNAAGASFGELSETKRKAFLEGLDQRRDEKDPAVSFYQTVKKRTIQAYTSSEFFLTKVQVYELVPGRYHGCVPVKAA